MNLITACNRGSVDQVGICLKNGENPNAEDKNGNTAIHWAAYHGSVETMRVLMQHGADIFKRTVHGASILEIAAMYRESDAMISFLQTYDIKDVTSWELRNLAREFVDSIQTGSEQYLERPSDSGIEILESELTRGDWADQVQNRMSLQTLYNDKSYTAAQPKSYTVEKETIPLSEAHHTRINTILTRIQGSFEKQEQVKRQAQIKKCIKTISQEPHNATLYFNLAGLMKLQGMKTITLQETEFNEQKLYLEAIRLNPDYARAYNRLGVALPQGESVTLSDGSVMSKQQLYIRAISLNPNDFKAYHNLANTLSQGESVPLSDETVMTKQQLLQKVRELKT